MSAKKYAIKDSTGKWYYPIRNTSSIECQAYRLIYQGLTCIAYKRERAGSWRLWRSYEKPWFLDQRIEDIPSHTVPPDDFNL